MSRTSKSQTPDIFVGLEFRQSGHSARSGLTQLQIIGPPRRPSHSQSPRQSAHRPSRQASRLAADRHPDMRQSLRVISRPGVSCRQIRHQPLWTEGYCFLLSRPVGPEPIEHRACHLSATAVADWRHRRVRQSDFAEFDHSRTGESGGSGGRARGSDGRARGSGGSGGREGRPADTALFALLMELSGSAT